MSSADTAGNAAAVDYGSPCFAAWREAAAPHWQAYTHHPFVAGLADGSLPRRAFLFYLQQDYLFLRHFARAWALAVVKADTLAGMRQAAAVVQALLGEEMQLHVAICEREGISAAALEGAEEAVENLAYTRYVMDAGLAGDMLDLLAALAPCVLGYGEIGARLSAGEAPPGRDAAYSEWIDTYGSSGYQALCVEVAGVLEDALARHLGAEPQGSPRWRALAGRFATATRLEVGFWDMGLRGRP